MAKSSNILQRNQEKSLHSVLILEEFKKPIFENRLYINKKALNIYSDKVKFKDLNWNQNPQKFCLDHYGEHEFYPIVLLANNIHSMFLFNFDRFVNSDIIAPKINDVIKILMGS